MFSFRRKVANHLFATSADRNIHVVYRKVLHKRVSPLDNEQLVRVLTDDEENQERRRWGSSPAEWQRWREERRATAAVWRGQRRLRLRPSWPARRRQWPRTQEGDPEQVPRPHQLSATWVRRTDTQVNVVVVVVYLLSKSLMCFLLVFCFSENREDMLSPSNNKLTEVLEEANKLFKDG